MAKKKILPDFAEIPGRPQSGGKVYGEPRIRQTPAGQEMSTRNFPAYERAAAKHKTPGTARESVNRLRELDYGYPVLDKRTGKYAKRKKT